MKRDIMKNPYGKYVWWPFYRTVDYIPKGQRQGRQIECLDHTKNDELGAIIVAVKHLSSTLKEVKDHGKD